MIEKVWKYLWFVKIVYFYSNKNAKNKVYNILINLFWLLGLISSANWERG
jgi:hypothetical protein